MADALHSNVSPSGSEASLVGLPGQQGFLYNWMRILAGGGTSEFSRVQMRGDLVLLDGTKVPSAGYIAQQCQGSPDTFTFSGLTTILPVQLGGGNRLEWVTAKDTFQPLPVVAGKTCLGASLNNIALAAALLKVTLYVRATAGGPGNVEMVIKKDATVLQSYTPKVYLAQPGATTDSGVLTGEFIVTNWVGTEDITVNLASVSGITVVVDSAAFSCRALEFL